MIENISGKLASLKYYSNSLFEIKTDILPVIQRIYKETNDWDCEQILKKYFKEEFASNELIEIRDFKNKFNDKCSTRSDGKEKIAAHPEKTIYIK